MTPLDRSRLLVAIARGGGAVRLSDGRTVEVTSAGKVQFRLRQGRVEFRHATPQEEEFLKSHREVHALAVIVGTVEEIGRAHV